MKVNIPLPCSVYIWFFRSERSSSSCSSTYCVFTKHSSNSCHCHHTLLEMNQSWVWFTVTSFHQNIKYHNDNVRTWKKPQNSKKGFLSGSSNIPPIYRGRREAQESFNYLWERPQETFPQNKAVGKTRIVDAAIKHKEGNITCKYTFIWMKQTDSQFPQLLPLYPYTSLLLFIDFRKFRTQTCSNAHTHLGEFSPQNFAINTSHVLSFSPVNQSIKVHRDQKIKSKHLFL